MPQGSQADECTSRSRFSASRAGGCTPALVPSRHIWRARDTANRSVDCLRTLSSSVATGVIDAKSAQALHDDEDGEDANRQAVLGPIKTLRLVDGFSVGGGVAATGASAGAAGAASSAGGSSAIMRSVEIAVLDGRVSGATGDCTRKPLAVSAQRKRARMRSGAI
eukprot:CAMPEP_0115832160 /NCGR_PEP_ID=MMETSP0287-20121206/2514_1 /TAXON_ID=412157 /ORGANISM="Chrysochromulina rotalis, Strain UIO044" /LENGTH=164 /DNA_ID=CAMNT_0003285535 /DNA_START=259 /DNA_END=754 /DNA_ORIENTATION=+